MKVDKQKILKKYKEMVQHLQEKAKALQEKFKTDDVEKVLKQNPSLEDMDALMDLVATLAVITEYKNLFGEILPPDDYGFD